MISCGDRGEEANTGTQPSPETDDGSDNCESKLISNDECFYNLPAMEHNQTFTGRYTDILRINTEGAVVGQGSWRCVRGTWQNVYSPVCLICLPGHSLEHCQNKLESLINGRTP